MENSLAFLSCNLVLLIRTLICLKNDFSGSLARIIAFWLHEVNTDGSCEGIHKNEWRKTTNLTWSNLSCPLLFQLVRHCSQEASKHGICRLYVAHASAALTSRVRLLSCEAGAERGSIARLTRAWRHRRSRRDRSCRQFRRFTQINEHEPLKSPLCGTFQFTYM